MTDNQKEDGPAANGTVQNNQFNIHYIAGIRRRRAAADISRALVCGCTDPWTCRCYENDEPTTRMTEAAIDAAEHLQSHGLQPLFSVRQARALWRAGRRDLATRTSTMVAAA